ncbi:hypothetical protein SLE2022_092480 [Rubroshorea leprosula]
MGFPRFGPAKGVDAEVSPNLYVANCGPAVGLSHDTIAAVLSTFGEVKGVYAADESGARVVVSFAEPSSAQSAFTALDGQPCHDLGGRSSHIRYSMLQPPSPKVNDSIPVALVASDLNIPGLYLLHDFISAKEEEELLAEVDNRPWKSLAKRRIQHYGYEFHYETRDVDTRQHLDIKDSSSLVLDQLTVNEYPPGVGLSPHIDTHSAFEGFIFSLSLAGPCIMEFRRYSESACYPKTALVTDMNGESPENGKLLRKAIYLPPRSVLLLSGEARYAWHHYIPHHKIDKVNQSIIRRGSRRVSFTLRKIRIYVFTNSIIDQFWLFGQTIENAFLLLQLRTSPCQCEFAQYCDSQR